MKRGRPRTDRRILEASRRAGGTIAIALALTGGLLLGPGHRAIAEGEAGEPDEASGPAPARIAALVYGRAGEGEGEGEGEGGRFDSSRCFNTAFLGEVANRSTIRVAEALKPVSIRDDALFEYPIAILAGEREFDFEEGEAERLAAYLRRGGFLMGSANCTAARFDRSFRKLIAASLPDAEFKPIANDHALMTTLFEVDEPRIGKSSDTPPLLGITIKGRLAVLYSPFGLNDSYGMKAECCCCGASELLNARQVNANAVVYAVTR